MRIKSVAVLGAGAVGGFFINGLSEVPGLDLFVVAEGERAERLSARGIIVNGKRIDLVVKTPEEAHGVDLLIINVKYGALKESIPEIKKIIDDHTIVLTTLNGVDSESVVGSEIGMEHMIYSVMKIASSKIGNSIRYDPEKTLGVFFGEADGSRSERIQALEELFDGTAVTYQVRPNILTDMWYKYALNISINIPQAILNCGFGSYRASEHAAYLMNRLRAEVVAVAAAKGIDISDPENPTGKLPGHAGNVRFSTLQDLDAGRKTEIEMFCGTLTRMAKELGVDTPFNEFAYHAIKALEEKNEGLF